MVSNWLTIWLVNWLWFILLVNQTLASHCFLAWDIFCHKSVQNIWRFWFLFCLHLSARRNLATLGTPLLVAGHLPHLYQQAVHAVSHPLRRAATKKLREQRKLCGRWGCKYFPKNFIFTRLDILEQSSPKRSNIKMEYIVCFD